MHTHFDRRLLGILARDVEELVGVFVAHVAGRRETRDGRRKVPAPFPCPTSLLSQNSLQ
ncbi:hypothetical protein WQQ_16740 [Hydrocarboniphaga effusa AP103]|uniref:Uncharacterized protein n=1 Tax=Hydrocarboniphaga effusa AP103 TaxID=1172194 RepID=I7ZII1_9GAMM|nr:hypothetical protein WQQ_16740 [Hydrocarboniphaga effusa AP103]